MTNATNTYIGSSLDDFLKDEGLREEVYSIAIKRTLAMQIEQARLEQDMSKSEMARRMKTSASQLSRLFDPDNDRIQLDTLMKAAAALDLSLEFRLVPKQAA